MQSTNPKKFIKFIAYLQVIGIVLVVLGHSFHLYNGGNTESTLLWRLLHSFRMPLFIFVSGYLMAYTTWQRPDRDISAYSYIKLKAKRLLIPFVFLTLITFAPRCLLSAAADEPMTLSWGNLLKAFFYSDAMPVPFFWFIHASFILLSITYISIRIFNKLNIPRLTYYLFLISVYWALGTFDIGLGSFLSLHDASKIAVYMVIGAFYCDYSEKIDKLLNIKVWWSGSLFFALWLAFFYLLEGTPAMILCSICGIIMCVCLAQLLVRKNITVLDHLVGANYMIFLLSWYFNVLCQQVLAHFVTLPWQVHTILSLVLGVYIPWLAYRYIVRNSNLYWVKIIAFLMGQSTTNKQKILSNR